MMDIQTNIWFGKKEKLNFCSLQQNLVFVPQTIIDHHCKFFNYLECIGELENYYYDLKSFNFTETVENHETIKLPYSHPFQFMTVCAYFSSTIIVPIGYFTVKIIQIFKLRVQFMGIFPPHSCRIWKQIQTGLLIIMHF